VKSSSLYAEGQEKGSMAAREIRVAIIGAGAADICAAIKLAESGIENAEIFEKAGDIGGTWEDNTYPGLTCDIPSHPHRYSFATNPDWSREYAPGPEIHTRHVSSDYAIVFTKVPFFLPIDITGAARL
jgi:cation diffusion facilitator CzcD-associated flavoprotein CzcO